MVETFAAETESESLLSWRIKEDPSLRNWLLGREEEEKGKEGKGERGRGGLKANYHTRIQSLMQW